MHTSESIFGGRSIDIMKIDPIGAMEERERRRQKSKSEREMNTLFKFEG